MLFVVRRRMCDVVMRRFGDNGLPVVAASPGVAVD
jgi:hypothetical protein